MRSRRNFLQITGAGLGLALWQPSDLLLKLLKTEPRPASHLLFDPEELPAIRERLQSPIFQPMWAELLAANLDDDRQFLEREIAFNNQLRHLPRVDDILQREAFIYLITQASERGAMARLAFEKILEFDKWDYFLEGKKDVIGLQRAPYTTQTLVLTYEWIADLLPEAVQTTFFNQLPEKGCEPCYRSLWGMLHPEQVVGWGFDPESSFYEERDMRNWPTILSRTNLRAVPMSALALGAIFLQGRDSRADRWLNVVKQSFEAFVDLFASDGSYPEGTGYCNYTCSELILLLEVVRRNLKQDWSASINWPGVIDFWLLTRMPSDAHPEGQVNFGDGGSGFFGEIGFWVARKYRSGLAQYAAQQQREKDRIFSVFYFDPTVPVQAPSPGWRYRQFEIGWAVVSTGAEKRDLVVALRSGGPANHEHADRNSLILKCYAENLLVDQWHPPYSHTHPAWALRTSPAHNTVLVDGKGHQYHDGLEGTNASLAAAKIVREFKTDRYVIVSSDATPAYQLVDNNVKAITRTLLVVPEANFIVVVDALQTKHRPARFSNRWFIDNADGQGTIEYEGDRFIFNRPQAKLTGCAAGNGAVDLSVSTFPVPQEQGIFPFLEIGGRKAARRSVLLVAAMAIERKEEKPAIQIMRGKNTWVILADRQGQKIQVQIVLKKYLPEMQVRIS
ncbi:MAG: heparinase II/III-family protein [candidate division KSB1 bacterium]|nr:heparinase II/III-family protein [candidate division KSB1 bacterium]